VPPSVAMAPSRAFNRKSVRATCQPPSLPAVALRPVWVERPVQCEAAIPSTSVQVASAAQAEAPAKPLPRAHSHNDYEHKRPLFDALDRGFCNIEADVHLVDGRLLVGHDPEDVNPERTLQAQLSAEKAAELGIDAVAHGCTAAGNDQVRFEVALRCLAPGVKVIAPVRDFAPSREQQMADLGLPNTQHPKTSWPQGHS